MNHLFLVADVSGRNPRIVRAANSLMAVREALQHQSVSELRRGVITAVWPLGDYPDQFHTAYDGEPLTEAHGRTDAKLVTRSLGNPHV